MHIAWSYRAPQFPGGDMPPGSSQIHEADIVLRVPRRSSPLSARSSTAATSPSKPLWSRRTTGRRQERERIFSAYDFQQGEVFGVELATGKLTNYSNGPGVYDEPEGIFRPASSRRSNRTSTARRSGLRPGGLHKLNLDGSGAMER